jgi:8-oxo-dGTP pyrophosphatase MutT (NUDIX family)
MLPYEQDYLLERMNNPKYPQNLGRTRPPGGGIDPGETPESAAARELFEELGVKVDPASFRHLGNHAGDYGDEAYLQLDDHGLKPGQYTASIGGDKIIELLRGSLKDPSYWGADPSQFQMQTARETTTTTGTP